MVWSRLAALAPVTEIGLSPNLQCVPDGLPELHYDTNVFVEMTTVTIKPGWSITVVLALYLIVLFASLIFRVISSPLAPIGGSFGLISLLASVKNKSFEVLEGAGLSDKLKRPVFVGLLASRVMMLWTSQKPAE